ncbi:two-component response regulator ORR24 [Jatropha curcas]|uniref:two-component response regulator ORR24 n=1 Tax=Jatropha curcas TaxID=180498 RepID=UPI001895E5A3|nr:two-component response regulator ORR24 [Jatropha curcas]
MVKEQKTRFKLAMAATNLPDMDTIAFLHVLNEYNIPVILMSSERSISVVIKSIAEGATFYLQKPIFFDDLKYVWQHAYRKKKTPTDSQQDQGDAQKSTDKQIMEENKKIATEEKENKENKNNNNSTEKKSRILWTPELHMKFTAAISELGDKKARPKPILEIMKVPNLTQRQVASHLQKYKSQVQRICEAGTANLPALSKPYNNFYARILEKLDNKTTPNCGFRIPSGKTPELNYLKGQCMTIPSGKETNEFKVPKAVSMDGIEKLASVEVSNAKTAIDQPYANNSLPNFDEWSRELEMMPILDPSMEVPELDKILTSSDDASNNMEAPRNISSPPASTVNEDQPSLLKFADDLLNIMEEEPATGEPNPSDVDRYCEWLIS